MARMTIAQLREKEVIKLSNIIAGITPEVDSLSIASNLMTRFYRLCGADERLLYLENDERTYNLRSTQELNEQTEKRLEALQAAFKQYGLKLTYFGYLPTITDFENREVIYRYFYN